MLKSNAFEIYIQDDNFTHINFVLYAHQSKTKIIFSIIKMDSWTISTNINPTKSRGYGQTRMPVSQ